MGELDYFSRVKPSKEQIEKKCKHAIYTYVLIEHIVGLKNLGVAEFDLK